MRSPVPVVVAASLVLAPSALAAQSGGGRSATIVARASVQGRTSLHVSTSVLDFQVAPGSTEATATVEFTAAARALPDAQVSLVVEAVTALQGPGGAADVEADLIFASSGGSTLAGTVSGAPATVEQWVGGGIHRGRILFTLRTSTPGAYSVPVRFAVSVP